MGPRPGDAHDGDGGDGAPLRRGGRGWGPGRAMHVAALALDLHLPHCRSLKEKRAVVRPILDGARHRYRVAAAEVERQDQWQRAVLGMAAVSGTAGHVGDILDEVERFVWSFPEVEVLGAERRWLEDA